MGTTRITVFDASGKEVAEKDVPADVFDVDVNPGLVHQVVRWQRARKRAGTHSTLTRTEVRGGGKKPWRQKGLGRARAGSNSSPLWVGGGVVHGPKPRSYDFRMNRKERRLALCGVISQRLREGRCIAVRDFGLSEAGTKNALSVLSNLGLDKKNTAVVVSAAGEDLVGLSLRNVSRIQPLAVEGLNVYDVLKADFLVLTERGVDGVCERLASAGSRADSGGASAVQ